MIRARHAIALALLIPIVPVFAAGPATQPAVDPDLDWALSQATTLPATRNTQQDDPSQPPTTQPSVLAARQAATATRFGTITLSNGQSLSGNLSSTPDQPLRVWDDDKKEYRDVPFKLVRSMEAKVLWERDEAEWKFKESGSDIKEYSGKTYPARETAYTLTLLNGQRVSGGVAAPIYVDTPDGQRLLVLHKRDKGNLGQTLKELVYIQKVEFAAE
jgi:hypothetical protein